MREDFIGGGRLTKTKMRRELNVHEITMSLEERGQK